MKHDAWAEFANEVARAVREEVDSGGDPREPASNGFPRLARSVLNDRDCDESDQPGFVTASDLSC